jgi:hypothetical protein
VSCPDENPECDGSEQIHGDWCSDLELRMMYVDSEELELLDRICECEGRCECDEEG